MAGAKEAVKMTPLPMRSVLVVCAVQFGEAFQLTVLLPFVPFMVADYPEIPSDQVRCAILAPVYPSHDVGAG